MTLGLHFSNYTHLDFDSYNRSLNYIQQKTSKGLHNSNHHIYLCSSFSLTRTRGL